MEKSIGFGIVGCGFFGAEFARIIHQLDGTHVASVYGGSGKSTQAVATEIGCEVEQHLEDLVRRSDIQAILVASPNHLHKEPVIQAAKHGKHVFCEKPIALTMEDCDAMLDACAQASVIFMAGHIFHFMSGIQQLKQLIAAGEIGRPLVCHAERTGWEERKLEVSWKKNSAQSGGHLFHHIHELDLLQSIMGPAQSVYTTGGNLGHQGDGFGDEEDVLMLSLQFGNGAVGTMQYGSGFRWGEHYIKINGTEGAVKLDFKTSRIELKKNNQITEFMLHSTAEENEERTRIYEMMEGGVIYGNPSLRPPQFLCHLMEMEMTYLRDVINGRPHDHGMEMLFDGSAAGTSIRTAVSAMNSLKQKKIMSIANEVNNGSWQKTIQL